jgi:hypothetical protein
MSEKQEYMMQLPVSDYIDMQARVKALEDLKNGLPAIEMKGYYTSGNTYFVSGVDDVNAQIAKIIKSAQDRYDEVEDQCRELLMLLDLKKPIEHDLGSAFFEADLKRNGVEIKNVTLFMRLRYLWDKIAGRK